jgi:hypothetical protein
MCSDTVNGKLQLQYEFIKKQMIQQFYHTYKLSFILCLILGLMGFLYWYFIGCSNGTCAITSSPINSSIYGMIMGFILGIKNNKK